MSSKTAKLRQTSVRPESPAVSGPQWWWYVIGLVATLAAAFEIYQPTLHAPFVFDDHYLPFFDPFWAQLSLKSWISGVRPLLMLGYWMNFQASQLETYSYHVVNVLLHFANAVLTWLVVRRILGWAKVERAREILALFCGILFLVHPVQTESVAYVASRSESQSVFFFLAALAVFVYRRQAAASVAVALAVLLLAAAAVLSKEHTAVLPALLLLTDYYWNPGFTFEGIRRNWKVYTPMVLGGGLVAAFVARILVSSTSAGFGMKDLPWYQYFFTQCRALWVYLRMFVLPYGLNIDHDFAISRSVIDHGAIFGLIALVALAAAAWWWRRELPLASYGYFAFLVLMAPTSSVFPIRDVLVERRLYLAFLPLLLILCEVLRRVRISPVALVAGMALVTVGCSVATYSRNEVWADPLALWTDTAEKSPAKSRPHFQLAFAYYSEGRCADALREYERTSQLDRSDYSLYIDWGLAADCAQQPQAAIEKFQLAVKLDPTAHAYSLIGMVHAKRNERDAALAALDQAEKVDPRFAMTYVYRGNLLLLSQEFDRAAEQFQKALAIAPGDSAARTGLDFARRRVTPTVK